MPSTCDSHGLRRSKRGCRRVCRDDRRCPPGLEPRHAVSRVSCYYRTRALTTLARAARFATAPRGSFRPLGREINNQTRTCRAGSSLLAARVDRVGASSSKRVQVLVAFPTDREEIGVVLASVSVTGGPWASKVAGEAFGAGRCSGSRRYGPSSGSARGRGEIEARYHGYSQTQNPGVAAATEAGLS